MYWPFDKLPDEFDHLYMYIYIYIYKLLDFTLSLPTTSAQTLLLNSKWGSLSASVDEALCKNRDKFKDLTPYIIQQTHDPLYNSCFLRKGT